LVGYVLTGGVACRAGFGKEPCAGGFGAIEGRVMKGHFERVTSVTAWRAQAAGVVLVVMMAGAMACSAGEIKGHDWPCTFVRQKIPDLEMPVVMDVENVYSFIIGSVTVKLERVAEGTYRGCSPLPVTCTFDLTLACSIEPTGVVPGEYSCSIDPAEIDAPGAVPTLCAEVTNARLAAAPAGKKSVRVATIRIRVTPR
jgi:hypothetical protein